MRQTLFLLYILAMTAANAAAQSFTLQGRVTDEQMAPMEFATVACVSQGKIAMTNLKGEFSLQLQSADSVVIRFSMVGYKTKTRVLRKPRGKQSLQITLYSDNTLSEVTVTEMRRQTGQTEELKKENMKNAPSTTGNAVEELIQSQAGVSTHSELSSQYNVRGGSFDENSVYINNVELYRPFLMRSGQQEGLSVINPDMVDKIGFSTGGFEAKYGDKMSSALDITYRRPKKFEATATASLLGGSAFVGSSNNKFSWSNGVRYKTNRYMLGSLETKGEYKPNYLDYQSFLALLAQLFRQRNLSSPKFSPKFNQSQNLRRLFSLSIQVVKPSKSGFLTRSRTSSSMKPRFLKAMTLQQSRTFPMLQCYSL